MPGEDRTDARDTFSRSAERYLVSNEHRSGPDLEIIRQVASEQFPTVTVDVATGAGHALRVASPFSGSCAALDLTMEMLLVARVHLSGAGLRNILYIQSSAESLPFGAGTVSLLTCRIAPHHFRSITAFLGESVRVLEPEGRCIIIDSISPEDSQCHQFINETERLRDPSHVRSYSLRQWQDFLHEAGFETISVTLFEREHTFRAWAERTGLDEEGIGTLEKRFRTAPRAVREKFKVKLDDEGKVCSYTDEKGIFLLKKVNRER